MQRLIDKLENRLKNESKDERKHILREIYKQMVPGRKSGEQKPGEYRDAASGGTEDLLGLVLYLSQRLEQQGMMSYVKRLKDYYSVYPPAKE